MVSEAMMPGMGVPDEAGLSAIRATLADWTAVDKELADIGLNQVKRDEVRHRLGRVLEYAARGY